MVSLRMVLFCSIVVPSVWSNVPQSFTRCSPRHTRGSSLSTVRHGHAIEKHYQEDGVKSPLHQLVESDYQ
jgi:hypothetical protein